MFAHLLHALVASGSYSRVHLTRILGQHSAHSCPSRLRSLALKPVSPPCHSPCTSPCAQFGYNQRASDNNWRRMCTPVLGYPRTTRCHSARTIVEHIRHPTEPLLCAQPARVAAPACSTCARTASRNCRNIKPERATQHVQELRHPGCTQCIAIARRECHNCSVVFRRLRISTGYSQPITAALSARCKGSIHANSTPIPLQTHGNR